MFPTFIEYTRRHPRLFVVFGLGLFINAFVLLCAYQNEDTPQVSVVENKIDVRTLLVPPDTSSPEALALYEAHVADNAVVSDTISLDAGCAMSPLIVRLPENSILKIDNRDAVEHTLAFEDQNFFNVSAGQIREINITEVFGKGSGIYRYRCNNISLESAVGIMYVVAQL
jgi:hypothetical protein